MSNTQSPSSVATIHSITFVALLSYCLSSASSVEQGDTQEERRGKLMMDIMRKKDVEISLPICVVDTNGEPISGAQLDMYVIYYNENNPKELFQGINKIQLTTDDKGMVDVKGAKGRSLTVKKITKSGYEYRRNLLVFQFPIPQNSNDVGKDGIARISIRKQNNPSVLLENTRCNMQFKLNTDAIYDFSKREFVTGGGDIIIRMNKEDDNKPVLKMSAIKDGDRIFQSDKFLHEFADEKHSKSIECAIPNSNPFDGKYFYIRSRDGQIHTRLSISGVSTNDQMAFVGGEYVSNPYGKTTFDVHLAIPDIERRAIERGIIEDLNNGRTPIMPDLSKYDK